MADIIEVIKKASMEAEEQSSPANILYGTVISVNPIQIQVEQKMVLTKEFLIFTKNVIDYDVQISLDWNTSNESINDTHTHNLEGNMQVISTIEPNDNNQEIINEITSNLSIQNANINIEHSHKVNGTKIITIHNGLKQNDKVILLQQRGGQKFVVLDKIY